MFTNQLEQSKKSKRFEVNETKDERYCFVIRSFVIILTPFLLITFTAPYFGTILQNAVAIKSVKRYLCKRL